ncbi:MAG: pyridoxal phosphate-dependent aminotransferase [Chloroflexota bacterium]|nr:pyridoxal phosphate-dependent aminotransferase [Chloroflexota bacterium]
MPYDFDTIPNRRAIGSIKWTWYPRDILPMWVADMDFAAPPPILDALRKFLKHGDLGYQLPSMFLYETVARRMDKLYNWKISPHMLVPISGVNIGYNAATRTFCTPRRGYLIQTPVYNEFHETQKKTGVRQVEAPLAKRVEGNRVSYAVDFEAFSQAAKKANLFLLCNPHNPVGKIYSNADLKRMADICLENEVLIVSDEIHSELLLDGNTFTPLATLSPEIADRTITLIAPSKAFNVPGLFCGFAIIPNEELRLRYLETTFKMGIHVASPGLVAAQVAHSGKCDGWLKALRSYLTDNRDFVMDYVTQHLPMLRTTVPDATYLAWLDCSALKLKPSPYEFFLKEAKVALSDGGRFGKGSEQLVRLNFGTSRKILKQGLDRMRKAIRAL